MKIFLKIFMVSLVCLSFAGCNDGGEHTEPKVDVHNQTKEVIDMAGRKVTIPCNVSKIYPTGQPGAIMLYTTAPDKLLGWCLSLTDSEAKYIEPKYLGLPVLGLMQGSNDTASREEIIKRAPDVILTVTTIDQTTIQQVDELQKLLGIPIVMGDIKLEALPKCYELVGKTTGETERAKILSDYCEETIKQAKNIRTQIPENQQKKIYYAQGSNGLQTATKGSNHLEVIELVGSQNAIDTKENLNGRVTVNMEQVLKCDPQVIIVSYSVGHTDILGEEVFRLMSKGQEGKMEKSIMNNNHIEEVINEVKKAIIGKDSVIELTMTAILAGGHILLEDIPGVGKTTLALAFLKAMKLNGKRMQFTPDVMPSDLTGFSIYNKDSGSLEYKEGALFCNLFLGDEINRTSPKTQSALLEAMEEGKISVDGITRKLPEPFIVIATQNPIGSSGTQNLPESQLDRFMVKLSMGYPDLASEFEVIKNGGSDILIQVNEVMDIKELNFLRKEVNNIYVDEKILNYILELVAETRKNDFIRLGLSPRGTLALVAMAKSYAMICGRDFVIPEDVQKVFSAVICHRIILEARAKIEGVNSYDVAKFILEKVGKVEIA